MTDKRIYVPVEIEKVLELKGAIRLDLNCPSSIYAHISKPVDDRGKKVQYAMLAIFPQHGIMQLGNINPETMIFEYLDPSRRTLALYDRANNHVVESVSVPSDQFKQLRKLEEVLSIPRISVKRELLPE